jgi:hypothetical protein
VRSRQRRLPAFSAPWRDDSAFHHRDCSVHPLVRELPFGGVGNSGMGKYHGHWGFETFANARGVLYHTPLIDPGVKYPPYSEHQTERNALTTSPTTPEQVAEALRAGRLDGLPARKKSQ